MTRNGLEINATNSNRDPFRGVTGLWSIPGRDGRPVPGTLSIDLDFSMKLTLAGGVLNDPMELDRPLVIHGEADDGKKITILGAYCTHSTSSSQAAQPSTSPLSRIRKQTWHAHEALIGRTFFDPQIGRVSCLVLSTERLPEWLGRLPFDFDFSEDRSEVSVQLPDRTPFEVRGAQGSIGWREGGQSLNTHNITARVEADICVQFPAAITLEESWTHWVAPLMQLILLCHGEGDRIHALHFSTGNDLEMAPGVDVPEKFEWVQSSWRGAAPPSQAKWDGNHLLPFSQAKGTFEEIIKRWFAIYEMARFPIMQHLAPQLSDIEPFLEEKFATRVRSLESFHRDVHGGLYMDPKQFSAIVDDLAFSHQDQTIDDGKQNLGAFFKARLQHANEFSLKKRLDLLLEDSGEVLNSDPENWRKAHRRIVSTRDSLTHRSRLGSDLSDEEAAHILEYLDELFRASVLRALGFDYSQVDAALSRRPSRHFRFHGVVNFDGKRG